MGDTESPENRSPRAMPLPPVEWEIDATPRDARQSVFKRKPRVILAYQSAKRHVKGKR